MGACWAMVALVALAGCGAQVGGVTAGGGASATTQARSTVTDAPTSTGGAASASPTSAPASTGGAAGRPQLILGAARFGPADDIGVTVRNGASATIYAEARFTDCSIVVLERQVASGWQPVNLCADGTPHPTVTQLAPGAQTALDLAPSAANSSALADSSGQWPAGTYRAALTYTTSSSVAFSAGVTVYSATFIVG
jgi:hypothetical protein